MHPLDPGDCAWLEAVNRGEFTIHGLRIQKLPHTHPYQATVQLIAKAA